MKIYTSYFANAKKLPLDIMRISISIFPPKSYFGMSYKNIAPTAEILEKWKQNYDEEAYIKAYNTEVLSQLTPDLVYNQLRRMTDGNDCVLLCYEKPGDFCHRHLFAEWMNKAGYDVTEWNNRKE